ncbi:xanthine dehydrogenase family protein molybdopterin-binding subunit [Pararhizobium mangrovi]|uniref:Xanthine dehydrogenase family protein molybdopterin-binding subunit n=1 Tax=Pararhizobium mangrovi TaxID=2590452 RepID=A0A506U675_9HYPH|nr:molybdopterin cofactor-binding domain-containing protein [Pararhizobium mangrovi]TPW28988.1 xanthine dehydrogenase family protein molybdopterin-binding subunit [Pararhizobium mangrovi]
MTLPTPLSDAPLVSDWIAFDDALVEVRTGRVELGQGNLTAIAQIAAEELDVPLAMIRIVSGDTTRTPNEGFTSGSLSVHQGGMAVRHAASAARHLAIAEAAKLLQCGSERLALTEGRILRDGAPTSLDLWSMAASIDLSVAVAQWSDPKRPDQRALVGKPLARIDLPERITGTPFVHDLSPDNLLHGRPVHPPSVGARLLDLDLDALRTRPGVVAATRDGSFVGVVADSEYAAIRAALWATNHATWSDEPSAPADPVAAIAGSQESDEVVHEAGTLEGHEGQSSYEVTVSRPYLSHASIGPSAAVAQWQDGRLSLFTQSQGVYPLRDALAMVFGMPGERIDVRHWPGAGCYGHNGADDAALDAALMARAVEGRPVKVVWSRADEFRYAPLGPAMTTRASAFLDETGRIAGMSVAVNSAPHGNRPGRNGAPNLRAAACLEKPFPFPRSKDVPLSSGGGADRNAVPGYAIANLRASKRIVHDLPYRTSSLRSLGAFTNVYAIETLMDAIARDRDVDPVSFRLNHLEDPRAVAVIEGAVAEAGEPFGREREDGTGWGLGYARYKNRAAYCAVVVRVEVDEAVRVTDVFAALDAGEIINPDGMTNQTEGGIVQSISWTLKEALTLEDGRVTTENWSDYPILTFSEVPAIQVRLIDRKDEPPLGCAEAAQGPTAAAIGNAVRDAIGVPVNHLPLTRDALIAAISE